MQAAPMPPPGRTGQQQQKHKQETNKTMRSYKTYGNSRYLKKEDFPSPRILTIGTAREEEVTVRGGEPKEKIILYFEEIEKGLVSNMAHGDTLFAITGSDDPDKWVGAKVEVYVNPNVEFGGKKEGGIRLRPIITNGETAKPVSVPMSQPRAVTPPLETDELPF
jgi:hypothetical protein